MKLAASIACICMSACTLIAQSQSSPQNPTSSARVDGIVSKMTLEEKVDYIGGTGLAKMRGRAGCTTCLALA